MILEETMGVYMYERYISFQFQMNKNEMHSGRIRVFVM